MSERTSADGGGTVEILSFRLDGQEYGLDIMQVREIRGWSRATPLPHAPSYVRGVINLRGAVLPVIDLAERLGLEPPAAGDRAVIIVVQDGGRVTGLLVEAVSDILVVRADDLQAPPDLPAQTGATEGCIAALTVLNDRMLRVLNIRAVLPLPEQDAA
jgi:purine-binding chemotaxis protein CheW